MPECSQRNVRMTHPKADLEGDGGAWGLGEVLSGHRGGLKKRDHSPRPPPPLGRRGQGEGGRGPVGGNGGGLLTPVGELWGGRRDGVGWGKGGQSKLGWRTPKSLPWGPCTIKEVLSGGRKKAKLRLRKPKEGPGRGAERLEAEPHNAQGAIGTPAGPWVKTECVDHHPTLT